MWTNKTEHNPPAGKTPLDHQETKLPTYWSTPFTKICLAMKIGHQVNSIVINKQANSLLSLIADGQYRSTSLGRDTWKKLIGQHASLKRKCNKEGFNCRGQHYSKARIGIISNEIKKCSTPDSRIGFGTGGFPHDVETRPCTSIKQTMVPKTLKRWAISWCNEYTNVALKILFDFIVNDQCPLQC